MDFGALVMEVELVKSFVGGDGEGESDIGDFCGYPSVYFFYVFSPPFLCKVHEYL